MTPPEVRAARADAFRKAKTYLAHSLAESRYPLTPFMCVALDRTVHDGTVNPVVAAACKKIITRELGGHITLGAFMTARGQYLPSEQMQQVRHEMFNQLIQDHSF